MRRPVLALVLVAVVLLAGCSVPGGPTDAASPTGTATQTGPSAATAPPGVDIENGALTDADALLEAHTESLVSAGFVTQVRSEATVLRDGEPIDVHRQQVVRVAPGGGEYNNTVVNPSSRFDVWGNDSVQAVRLQASGGVEYGTGEPQSAAQLTGASLLSRYLSTGGWSVANTTRQDGTTLYTLRSTTVPDDAAALPENATDVREYGAVVVVDSEGRVHYFEASGTYTLDGETGEFTLSQRLASLGDPGVERPPWVDEAL